MSDLLARIERDEAVTDQEIFDHAATVILKQGGRSVRTQRGNVVCCYRGKGGAMCAVGALIPDSLYSKKMEGQATSGGLGVSALASRGLLPPSLRPHEDMLSEMQAAHDVALDGARFAETYKLAMRTIAHKHKLSGAVVA